MTKGNILITGGSGLIGTQLTDILLQKGYKVSHLSRKAGFENNVTKYFWDPASSQIDTKAFENIDHIIHLAGAGIADKRWTSDRKKEILNSRIESSKLLFETLKTIKNNVKSVISSSAIGFYGFSDNAEVFDEKSKNGTDFLAKVTKKWEEEVDKMVNLKLRIVKLRIGVVLTNKGGALPQLVAPIKYFVGAPLGTGKQIVSWIDLADLCSLFVFAIENTNMTGAYNAVAPNTISNESLTKAIAKQLNRPVWPIKVPDFLLKLILGEMAVVVTGSCNVQNKRINDETDFTYQFDDLTHCLKKYL
jgi:uncharacterized protein